MSRQICSSWRRTRMTLLVLLLATGAGCATIKKVVAARPTPASGSASDPGSSAPPDASLSGPAGGPVPGDFVPASVTFVSPRLGWVLGTALCPSAPCSTVVRSRDGGKTWVGIPGPPTDVAGGRSGGVGKIRFADAENGWAFAPELWTTHDGGAHWARPVLAGVAPEAAVADLAASAGIVHAAVYDSGVVHILTSPVGTDTWQPASITVPLGAGPVPQTQLVLQGGSGWLMEVNRTVIAGARLTDGSWASWKPPCADAGGPGFLAAPTPTDLVAICDEGVWTGGTHAVRAYASSDGGTTFQSTGVALPLSCCSAVASGLPATAVAAENSGDGPAALLANFQGGYSWTSVYRGGPGQSWNDLGFTTRTQGVALAVQADPHAGSLLMTVDGGHTWKVAPIR